MKDLFGEEPMLALSWKQPFGTAMLYEKDETRTWNTKYRGLVLICTSKAAYDEKTAIQICGEIQFIRLLKTVSNNTTLNLGGYAIAVGRLVNTKKMTPKDEDKTFVKYNEKLYCHIYEDVRPIKPFEWKGCQGWKKVDADIRKKIIFI